MSTTKRHEMNDCSGYISAVAFGVFCVLGSLFLFYLISGPPTFLDVVTMSPGDTLFHNESWSRLWCECIQFESFNNRSLDDIALYRLPANANLPLSDHVAYNVTQNVSNPLDLFEYWQVYLHPGSRARACYSFNHSVNFYFAPRYYVDGLDRDPDYAGHSILTETNRTSGCVDAPQVNVSGGWAFVWEKQFQLQDSTVGVVEYEFELTEFAVPSNATALAGWGRFCWATDAPPDAWLLAASREAALRPRLQAHLWCVPRLSVAVPVTAVPVVIAALLEILIIVFCICKPLRARKKAKYLQI